MEKSKKFRMPAGIRNKLTAAIAMLLVSSIMMVSSTYAWFTLSTAPEVTGITTSVGANGNLEMALLTTDTFGNLTAIGSSVGDSSAAAGQTVKDANITWGNLVDLSSGYGLNDIALLPAALNTLESGKISMTNPLLTAVYGADGRVSTVDGQTVSTVATNGVFAVGASQTYGVRAIGVSSNLSARDIALRNAKSAVNSTISTAKTATKSAIYTHMAVMMTYAMKAQSGGAPDKYTQGDLAAFIAIANGVITDLNALESGYRNAAIAYAAKNSANDEDFATLKTAIEGAQLSDLATASGVAALSEPIADLVAAQNAAKNAKNELDAAVAVGEDITAAGNADMFNKVNAAIKLLVDNIVADGDSAPVNVNITGGAVGELGAQVGTFEVASVGALGTVYAGAADATGAKFGAVALAVSGLTIENAGTGASNITDTYGYIIDFAFRTNAAESFLQLQTSAVNRVYTDQTNADLATQGSGSTVTYVYHPSMTVEQVNKMLGAIRLLFVNAADGTILQTGKLTDIAVNDTEATANVRLVGYETSDEAPIVALAQNQATAISVLVYLDGYSIDNTAVPNAATSGMLNLNLQFSSSAELIPMQNTALEQMTAYTVSFDANGGFGYMADVRAAGQYTVPGEPNFTRTNYQFKGWAKTATISADTELITAPFELTANTTLYAIWEPATTYTVSFDGNGGTETMNDMSAIGGEKFTLPENGFTAPAGMVFGGWKVGEQTLQPGAKITVTANTTVTAVWVDEVVTYAVTVPAGVTGEATAVAGNTYNFTIDNVACELDKVTMGGVVIEPTNEGYHNYSIENVTGDIVINVIKKYTVTFEDTSNGEANLHFTTYTPGTELPVTVVPDTGYKFSSLTYTVEGGQPVTVNEPTFTMPEGNVTVRVEFVLDT